MESEELLAKMFAGKTRATSRHVILTTASGRKFQYEWSDYPIKSDMTADSALRLAKKIYFERYRRSDWDRKHPRVNIEKEIVDALVAFILQKVEDIKQVEAREAACRQQGLRAESTS